MMLMCVHYDQSSWHCTLYGLGPKICSLVHNDSHATFTYSRTLIKDTPNKGHLLIKDTFNPMLILTCII